MGGQGERVFPVEPRVSRLRREAHRRRRAATVRGVLAFGIAVGLAVMGLTGGGPTSAQVFEEAVFVPAFPFIVPNPDHGVPGASFVLGGFNLSGCPHDVSFSDSVQQTFTLGTVTPDVNGVITDEAFTVPQTAQPGAGQLSVACDLTPEAVAAFTVDVPPPTPVLSVDPAAGLPGDPFTVTGDNHFGLCTAEDPTVSVFFGSTLIGDATPDEFGQFTLTAKVPEAAPVGAVQIASDCTGELSLAPLATTPFTVVGLIPSIVATNLSDTLTATDLAQSLAGTGVTVSNVTHTGSPLSAGTFTEGLVPDLSTAALDPPIIGFRDGIILSSGDVNDVEGRNDSEGTGDGLGLPGDTALDQLAGFPTHDASTLELDFVPSTGTVAFQYVFASEEYNEFVNDVFNDVFAFFVNGQNCALVPGTNDPVSINTVNNGNPFGTDPRANPTFYRNNSLTDPGPPSLTIEPDGLTTVLKCLASVNPGQVNHMKLAIADGSDEILDSWVFLAADSLVSVPPVTGTPVLPVTDTEPPSLVPALVVEPTTTPTTTPAATGAGSFTKAFTVTTQGGGGGEVAAAPPEETTTPSVLGEQQERTQPDEQVPPRRGERRGTPGPGERSTFPASLILPGKISTDLGLLAQNAGLAVLLVLLILFPAEIFNKTLEENYDEIKGWFARIRRFGRKVKAALEPIMGEEQVRQTFLRTPLVLLAFATVAALFYGFLDPTLGLNKGSAALLLGFLLAIVVVTLVYELAAAGFVRRRLGVQGEMRAFPGALVVAIVCIAISRLVDFAPGYLFGIIAGMDYRGRVSDEDEGRAIAFGALNMLVLAIVSYLLWGQVDDLVQRSHPHFLLLAADALLAATFVAGIEGLIFGLLPLRFLDGEKVLRYSQVAWVTLFGTGVYAFVHILLHPHSGYIPTSDKVSVFTVVALFVAFGLFSFAFWGYFKLREEPEDEEEEEESLALS